MAFLYSPTAVFEMDEKFSATERCNSFAVLMDPHQKNEFNAINNNDEEKENAYLKSSINWAFYGKTSFIIPNLLIE